MKLFAKNIITGNDVIVTLRPTNKKIDLAGKNINFPAYIHQGRKTISGRLQFCFSVLDVDFKNYYFVPNN